MTLEFVKAMLAAFKDEQLIHRRYAFEIILQVRNQCAGSEAGSEGGPSPLKLLRYPLPAEHAPPSAPSHPARRPRPS